MGRTDPRRGAKGPAFAKGGIRHLDGDADANWAEEIQSGSLRENANVCSPSGVRRNGSSTKKKCLGTEGRKVRF